MSREEVNVFIKRHLGPADEEGVRGQEHPKKPVYRWGACQFWWFFVFMVLTVLFQISDTAGDSELENRITKLEGVSTGRSEILEATREALQDEEAMHVKKNITLKQLADLLNSAFGYPSLPQDMVKAEQQEDGSMVLKIGTKTIQFDGTGIWSEN